MKRKILVVSDIHAGSPSGLIHPNYVDVDGNPTALNPRQNFLWDGFTKLVDSLPSDIDEIVFNGDAIDGKQRANQGEELTLHRIEDQRLCAVMILREVQSKLPNAIWHFVMGTRYHEEPADVRLIARHFTQEVPELSLRLGYGKARLLFHHEVGFSGGYQKAGSLEREIVRGLITAAKHGWKDYHAQIRSHVHYFYHVGMQNHLAISTPCFQLMSPFTLKGSPHATIPDLGCLVLHVDDSLIERGICPVGFEEYLFAHPEPDAVILEEPNEVTA